MADSLEFGSTAWAEAAGGLWPLLPPAGAADGTVSLGVGLAPRKEVAWHWRYEGGKAVAGGPGGGDADLSLTLGAADAPEVLSGRVEPSVAFMRGRLKTSGSGGLLLAFLESTTSEGFAEWRGRIESLAPLPG
jgi:hypothetical protein